MNFDESVEYLISLGHEILAIKLGLRNTELLLAELGYPHQSYESVQIAGTNGKGSTAVILDSICRAAGIRTGLFTSPHLISITERIVIDGAPIDHNAFADHATVVAKAAQNLVARGDLPTLPTFFEHVTAIALLAFREANVPLAILETGLGGRLDATTVAGAGIVGITTLALDHQNFLGDSLAQIAAEKAAIIHRGSLAVVAPQPPEALDIVLQRCAAESVAPVLVNQAQAEIHGATEDGRFKVRIETQHARYANVLLGLRGRHQVINTQVAIGLAEALEQRGFGINESAIVTGSETAKHAGRLELCDTSPRILFDGAHNISGAVSLRDFVNEFIRSRVTMVFASMRDKPLKEVAAILFPLADRLIVTMADNPRSANVDDLADLGRQFLPEENVVTTRSSSEAVEIARRLTSTDAVICVTGSLYLIGELKAIVEARSRAVG